VGKLNRCLAALPAQDFSLLAPHLRTVPLECGVTLHDVGDESEYVYFPNSGMVSSVAIMQSGATVETGTVGRAGIIGATAGLGSRRAFGKAVVQIAGDAVRLGASQFHVAAIACNALHVLQSRLCRWLLQTQDCISSDVIPLTQEVLAQMLGVRRTTLTMVARLLQRAGMIRYRRGVIHIVSRAALEENACECYAVIKRHADNLFSNIAAT